MIPDTVRSRLRPYRGGRLQGRYVALPRNALTWGLSPCAVLAYALLLDRTELSARNGWADEAGETFVHYSMPALSRDLGACETTVRRVLAELEENGLLRRKGTNGKPVRLYLLALPAGEEKKEADLLPIPPLPPVYPPLPSEGTAGRDLSPEAALGPMSLRRERLPLTLRR